MTSIRSSVMVCALCALVVMGCKKKQAAPAAQGSGSAAVVETGSATMTGSADTGSAGSAMAGSDVGSAAMAGSADMGSAAGSAAAGSASGSGAGSATAGGPSTWNCKKACKLALSCKSKAFTSLKECDSDCTNMAKDKDGRYARGSVEGSGFYTCINDATDCAGIKKCDQH
jgi:hypothetical protein